MPQSPSQVVPYVLGIHFSFIIYRLMYVYVCHHSAFGKVKSSENKKGKSKNVKCPSQLDILIKLNTAKTQRTDPFIKNVSNFISMIIG